MTKALLIIDPQNDFMDSPEFMGSLAVPGAYADMQRLSTYILSQDITDIFVTLDSHSVLDIAHASWWIDPQGNPPEPFTVISVEDISSGKWRAFNPTMQAYSEFYVNELAKAQKYELRICPFHCIEGTQGHEVEATLKNSLHAWEVQTGKKVQYIYKGRNPKTEHYSGLKAEVVLENENDTKLNTELIALLDKYDAIEVGGEALSHCTGITTHDLVDNIIQKEKVTLLRDCTSPVTGFEKVAENLVQSLVTKGVQIKNVTKKIAKLGI